MAHFSDFSQYEYELPMKLKNVENIGWLSHGHEYTRGEPPPEFTASLRWCCCECSTNVRRGSQECIFCDIDPIHIDCGGRRRLLGSAEIWVPSGQKIYAAPNLIFHYVEKHNYCPPKQFIDAVIHLAKTSVRTDHLYSQTVCEAIRELGL
jgi:hypothetical protein